MKKLLALLLSIAMIFTLAACGGSGEPSGEQDETPVETKTVVWGNYGSSQMPVAKGDLDAIAYIEEATGGSLKFEYSADGVLGGEADMMQQIMDGTIQVVTVSSSTFAPYTDMLEVFQLPFLITDYKKEFEVLTSDEAQALYDKVGDELGVKIIGVAENGIRHFANNKKPIKTVADLKGLKLRIVPSNMLTEVMTNLGAAPMSVAYAEVYSALQNNVVDGEEINITSIYAMKHYEQLKYISEIGMYPFPTLVVMNKAFWDSLTPDEQQAVLEGEELGAKNEFEKYLPEYEEEAKKEIEAYGVEFNTIEGAEKEEFVEIAKTTWQAYYDKDPLIAAVIDLAQN